MERVGIWVGGAQVRRWEGFEVRIDRDRDKYCKY